MRVVTFALLLFVSLLSWAQEPRNLPILGNEDEPRRPMGPRRELEPPSVPVARPTPADKDADGLDDGLEERLLQKFAPVFRFDSREDTFPATVEDFLAQSVLMFSHPRCRDHVVLGPGELNTRSLVRQTHNFGCQHNLGSTSSTTPIHRVDRWLVEFFYIDFIRCPGHRGLCEQRAAGECGADAECRRTFIARCLAGGYVSTWAHPCSDHGITRGVQNVSRLQAYGGVSQSMLVPNAIEIRVRLFYPASTQTRAGFGYHEGDWAGVGLHITRDEQIHTVRYFNHDGNLHTFGNPERWLQRRPELVDGTHVVVYVAAQSHASYPFAGEDGRGAIKPTDHHRGNHRFSFPTQGRIVNVGSSKHPFPGFGWLEFSGFWGEHFDAAELPIVGELEGSSPKSPSY
ncbi:MAG TPA: hypothetical protein VHK90_12290 [Thermoanaerobaculia bacterium]|nr:hypothetical protein [Thermoanaerobaculia bacterium]